MDKRSHKSRWIEKWLILHKRWLTRDEGQPLEELVKAVVGWFRIQIRTSTFTGSLGRYEGRKDVQITRPRRVRAMALAPARGEYTRQGYGLFPDSHCNRSRFQHKYINPLCYVAHLNINTTVW